jgi:flagellar FliL protein
MADKKDEKKDEKAADKKPEKAEVTPEEAAAKAKKRKLLLFIVAGVVLTAGIGAGLAVFLSGGDKMAAKSTEEGHGEAKEEAKAEHGEAKEEAKAEHGEKKEEAKEGEHGEKKEGEGGEAAKEGPKVAKLDNIDFGCTMPFQPFHLNLGNPLENRYIRLEISVEYGCNEETKAELERRLPQLKDAVIAVTRRKTREFLLGPDGMEQLRKEIQTRVNHYMTKKIDDVFITDILIE